MMALPVNQAAAWLAERMLNGVPVGIAVALAAWIVLRLLGRRNSSTRFAVWFSALLAIAVSSLLGSLLPRPAGVAGARASAITAPGSWATVLLIVWAFIAGVALLRVGLGLWNLRKLRANHAALAPAALHPMLQRTLSEFCVSRDVTLAISGELRVPTAIGFLRPMIILPAWTLRELPPEKLNAILIHELAHLKRWDDCTNLVQKILRALFFFNPAVCWIETRLSLEREMACDDVVLSRTANPRAYAECLVFLAERNCVRRGVALAQAAVSRMRHTSRRVAEILGADRPRATGIWRPALAMATVFSALGTITLSGVPQLVAFQNASEPIAPLTASSAIEPASHASVIPASFKANAERPSSVATSQKTPRPVASRRLEAKLIKARSPFNAQATVSAEDQFRTQTVLVVMQTRNYDAPVPSWTLCIWRVTFVNSAQVPVTTGIPAKSI